MNFTKTKIYNLALSHLLLSRQVTEIDTDTVTNEVRVLNTFWDIALLETLQDLDLDSTSQSVPLELLEKTDGSGPWLFIYKYPSNCAFFRRIQTRYKVDNSDTHEPKKVALYNGQKVIYTNKEEAIAEIIPDNFPLETLGASAVLAISYNLAYMSSSLIVGKGAARLKQEIYNNYLLTKIKAQETDSLESFDFDNPVERSDWVRTRVS